MPDCDRNYVRIIIAALFLIITFKSCVTPSVENKKNADIKNIAKKHLITKEKEYLKSKPLSEDLQKFINRYKRANNMKLLRPKRINAGKKHKNAIPGDDSPKDDAYVANPEAFTVIPLVVPVTLRKVVTGDGSGGDGTKAEAWPAGGFEVTTECYTNQEGMDFGGTPKASGAAVAVAAGNSASAARASANNASVVIQNQQPESTKQAAEETTTEEDDSYDKSRKAGDAKVLNKVLESVQALLDIEKEGTNNGVLEDAPCDVNGDWDSEAGGVQFHITRKNNTHTPHIIVQPREPPPVEDGFLTNGSWAICGHVPFNHSSMIVLKVFGRKKKKIAVFIGECRICEGAETITGNWLIGRSARNCNDREAAHIMLSEIMRKNNVKRLQHDHLAFLKNENDQLNVTNASCFGSQQ